MSGVALEEPVSARSDGALALGDGAGAAAAGLLGAELGDLLGAGAAELGAPVGVCVTGGAVGGGVAQTGAVFVSSFENWSPSPAFTTRCTVSGLVCSPSGRVLLTDEPNFSVGRMSFPSTLTVTVLVTPGLYAVRSRVTSEHETLHVGVCA